MTKAVDYKKLLDLADEASINAYARYSDFQVGACALYESEKVYTGCNVENASYGLTLCAERNAMSNAIASGEKEKLRAIAIKAQKTKLCYPCGACLQWINEFNRECEVILEGENSEIVIYKLSELLPHMFNLK